MKKQNMLFMGLSTNIPLPFIQLCILFSFVTESFEKCGDLNIIGIHNDTITKSSKTGNYNNWIKSNT